jgi:tetrahydromethanopterin S-methyltransferase subunit B
MTIVVIVFFNQKGDYMTKTLRCMAILTLLSVGLANAAVFLRVDNNAPDKIKIEPYALTILKPGTTYVAARVQDFIVTFQDNTIDTLNIRLNTSIWSGSPIRVPLASFPMQDGQYNVTATYTSSGNQITLFVNAKDQNGVQYKSIFTKRLP